MEGEDAQSKLCGAPPFPPYLFIMIQLSAAGKRFGPKMLFENLDWLITPRDRVGLVGANGTGKTTLLKALARLEPLDYGEITFAKGITAGYLPQDGLTLSGRTVMAECMSVFGDLLSMEQEMESPDGEDGGNRPGRALNTSRWPTASNAIDTEFQHRDGYSLEAQVGMVLGGLGFPPSDWHRRTEEFSGGWQMRIALAKLLLEKPNLLLLDEPTNHLDLEARNWLEEYLHDYPHACVLISHDRFFLDVTVKKMVEIWNQRVHFYTGNYEKYLKEKTERRAQIRSGLPEPEGSHRAARSVHQPLPLHGHQGQAGAKPHQGTRADGAHRDSQGREGHPLQISAAQAERAARGGVPARRQELRRQASVPRT